MNRLKVFAALVFILASSSFAIPQPAPPPTAPATTVAGANVTTTAPVTSTTTIETGTIAGQALMWVTTTFGSIIGMVLTGWLFRMFKLAGLQVSDTLRAKLQEIIVNGLNAGAKVEADNMRGKGQIEVKNNIVAHAVVYAQSHGAETLNALGLDPTSPAAVEAIKARIETAISDPTVPTPAVLDKTAPTPNAAAFTSKGA